MMRVDGVLASIEKSSVHHPLAMHLKINSLASLKLESPPRDSAYRNWKVEASIGGFKFVRFDQANQVLTLRVKSMLTCLCVPPSQSITPGKPAHALVDVASLMTGGTALVSICR
jgi:hypothetical protein